MGSVAIIGAGPGGLAAALAMAQAGHEVSLFERAAEVRSSGNILNLWPPPVKALGYLASTSTVPASHGGARGLGDRPHRS